MRKILQELDKRRGNTARRRTQRLPPTVQRPSLKYGYVPLHIKPERMKKYLHSSRTNRALP